MFIDRLTDVNYHLHHLPVNSPLWEREVTGHRVVEGGTARRSRDRSAVKLSIYMIITDTFATNALKIPWCSSPVRRTTSNHYKNNRVSVPQLGRMKLKLWLRVRFTARLFSRDSSILSSCREISDLRPPRSVSAGLLWLVEQYKLKVSLWHDWWWDVIQVSSRLASPLD